MASIGRDLPISRQAVAKHLDILLGAGLVRRTKAGREVQFALNGSALQAAQDWLKAVNMQWNGTLDRLKLFVETES